jgi:hypothetical protein
LPQSSKNLLPVAGLNAAEALQQGRKSTPPSSSPPEAPVVQVLLRSPGVQGDEFQPGRCLSRRFPFLKKRFAARRRRPGARLTPPRDTILLAPTANLIVRDRPAPGPR